VAADNRLQADGVYTYSYDAEGNRTGRTNVATGVANGYTWDYRNRLTDVTTLAQVRPGSAMISLGVHYTYDIFDRDDDAVPQVTRLAGPVSIQRAIRTRGGQQASRADGPVRGEIGEGINVGGVAVKLKRTMAVWPPLSVSRGHRPAPRDLIPG
jgi:hypothetical protein